MEGAGRRAAGEEREAGPKERRLHHSPAGLVVVMIFVIVTVIIVTELLERHFVSELEAFEIAFHVLALVVTLAPFFYFFWYRPLMQEVEQRRRTEAEVRDLSHRLLVAREDERRQLGRDLHDEIGQKLTSLQLRIENLDRLVRENPRAHQACWQLVSLVRELGDDLRRVLADLRSDILDDLGLVAALEDLFRELAEQLPELVIDFGHSGIKGRFSRPVETVLYRVCQEALNNVVKHARGGRVEGRLALSYPSLILTIRDDGCGFDAEQAGRGGSSGGVPGSFGLIGMRERVASVGGTLRVSSRSGQGTRVRVEVPVATGREQQA